jgi:hypothetical protein
VADRPVLHVYGGSDLAWYQGPAMLFGTAAA